MRPEAHFSRVFELAGIESLVMTNDPFDDRERSEWEAGKEQDARFLAALRLDPLLNDWLQAHPKLVAMGYRCGSVLDAECLAEIRRFLEDSIKKMKPMYAALSLPPTFAYPEDSGLGSEC